MFKEIKTLFILQLKEKLDLSFLKSKKETAFKITFYVLGFVIITLISYFVLFLCQFLNLFSALGKIPNSFMTLVFFLVFLINCITCTVSLTKSLYYSDDNKFLVTLPCNPTSIFLSKMLVFYLSEIKRAFIILIPIFLAFGAISNLPFYYYIFMPILIVLFSFIPVLIGGILSIPTSFLLRFLKRSLIIKYTFLILVLSLFTFIVIKIINLIPPNINLIKTWSSVSQSIRNFLNMFTRGFFTPFFMIIECMCGIYSNGKLIYFTKYSYLVPIFILITIAVLILINLFSSRPLYLSMITKSFEFTNKVKNKTKKNHKMNSFVSSCFYESMRSIRNTSKFMTSLIFTLLAPVVVLFINRIYQAIDTRLMGTYFCIAFNVLVITLFITMSNVSISSILSSDGEALYLNKIKIQKPSMIIYPRLTYNIIFSLITLVTSFSIFVSYIPLKTTECFFAFLSILFLVLTHVVWSCDFDFTHIKNSLFKVSGTSAINPNEVKSSLLALILSAAYFGISLFLLTDDSNSTFIRLAILTCLLLVVRVYLLNDKLNISFREIS